MANQTCPVAIITGGGQGIGKAIAQRFLRLGMAVYLAESDNEAGRETESELGAFGRVRFVATDVSREADIADLVQTVMEEEGHLDALVNNAGIMRRQAVTSLSLESWHEVIGVNLTGPFLAAKHAAPHLRHSRGAIINISSTRALMSEPDTEAYSATKGGLIALTHALAISLGSEVRVNCISPGWIDVSGWKKSALRHQEALTPQDHAQHPSGRVGRPEDIAALAAFLISPEAEFITGQNIVADGGMTRKMIYFE